jgi:UDPglucose 6-dehydrogenase
MKLAVAGLWHLGCVTAACEAAAGHEVVGVDFDARVVADLQTGRAPLEEPGLDAKLAAGIAAGRLRFTTEPEVALSGARVLWVTFDTPVDHEDRADVGSVRARLQSLLPAAAPGTIVLLSSQLPVGFTRELEQTWTARGLRFACSPENLRLGRAIESFERPERVVVGVRAEEDRATLAPLFSPFTDRTLWMSVESAEMAKHAVNAFLATSVTFINELARLCEVLGADAKEVERALRSEPRIGVHAYVSPGAAFAGGTLARDLRYLAAFGREHAVATPLVDGVVASNECHREWLRNTLDGLLAGLDQPVVAVLGLTYKPGTNTLRRSSSVELCAWLSGRGVEVRAHDPAVSELPPESRAIARVCTSATEALTGADVAVVATAWPAYRDLTAEGLQGCMRRPRVVDPSWFLAAALGDAAGLTYVAPGRRPQLPVEVR